MFIKIAIAALFAAGAAYAWFNGWLCRHDERWEVEHAGLSS